MFDLSRHMVAVTGLAMGILAGCTATRGALYVLPPDGDGGQATQATAVGSIVGTIDAPTSADAVPRCLIDCAPLPVIVDDPGNFVASGYSGDWKGTTEVTSATDAAACSPARAHTNAVGKCHHWTWKFSNALCSQPSDPPLTCPQWSCVAWLKPSNLFASSTPGRAAGLAIAPGATKVRFWAWAKAPTAVRFKVGSEEEDFEASLDAQLTTNPQLFAVDISTVGYNVVNRGFQWCSNDARFDSLDFYVDDIQWTAE